MNRHKNKGAKAEREVAHLLSDLLGADVVRKLGAGRAEDTGDLYGLSDWTLQVKNYADLPRAIREGLDSLAVQQANAGTTFGAALVRRRGGRWIAVMDLEGFATVVRELGDTDG